MDHIFLFGGNGFLGKNLQEKLKDKGIQHDVIDIACKPSYDLLDKLSCISVKNEILVSTSKSVCIVLMAANLGSKQFEKTPIELYAKNQLIDMNCIDIIKNVSMHRDVHVVYYSSSEVYGEDASLNENSCMFKIQLGNARQLYSYEKLGMEIMLRHLKKAKAIKTLQIFRPFNVSGKHQKKGVVFDMVMSAIEKRQIFYAEDVTREITSVQDATNAAFKYIIKKENVVTNLTSGLCMSMKNLAISIKSILEELGFCKDIQLVPFVKKQYIKSRSTRNAEVDVDAIVKYFKDKQIIEGILSI